VDSEATQLPKILGSCTVPAVRRGYWCALEPSLGAQNWLIGRCANPIVNARSCRIEGIAQAHRHALNRMLLVTF
jgi:hypothetical protein